MTRCFITSLLLPLLVITISSIFATESTRRFTKFSTRNAVSRAAFATTLLNQNSTNDGSTNNNNNATLPNPNIVGGGTVNDDEFPWFGRTKVSLFDGDTFVSSYVCGGSLIYSDIVVSAAHCIVYFLRENPTYDYAIEFNLGANRFDGSDGTVYTVTDVIWPTDYNSVFFENDIVFYRLNSSTIIQPVSWNTDPSIPNVGDIGTAVGFGFTSDDGGLSPILLKVNLPASSIRKCKLYYLGIKVPDSITCADNSDEGKSICSGDTGGPIVTASGELYGISSFVPADGCTAGPAGFTRTSSFNDFIPKVICDFSTNPPVPCTGFDESDQPCIGFDETNESCIRVNEACGLFGLALFCPFTFGGIIIRFFSVIFGL